MRIRTWHLVPSNAGQLALLGIALAMLGATGCGGSAQAQESVIAGDVLQSLTGTVLLGPDDPECRIAPVPGGGIQMVEPSGIRIVNPSVTPGGNLFHQLFFGPGDPGAQGECRIRAAPGQGMFIDDPEGVAFTTNVQVQGDVLADSFTQSSSRDLKSNIRPITDALERIARLEGVYFDWKPAQGGKADLGFVAEDVAKALPQAVTRDVATGHVAGVKYANVVAVAVEGIKAQQGTLERLSAENERLRAQVDRMEARLERLLARLEQIEAGR